MLSDSPPTKSVDPLPLDCLTVYVPSLLVTGDTSNPESEPNAATNKSLAFVVVNVPAVGSDVDVPVAVLQAPSVTELLAKPEYSAMITEVNAALPLVIVIV
jgi:hypothetical protein